MPKSRRAPPGGPEGGAGGGKARSLHDHASDLAEYLARHAEVGNVIDTLNTSQRLGAPPPLRPSPISCFLSLRLFAEAAAAYKGDPWRDGPS